MTSTTPVFTRPISATERLYLATAPLAEPFAIQLLVEGAGDIDVDVLRRAVERASDACPGARLVRRGDAWVDSGLAPHLEIVEHGGVDFTALDANPILTRPLGVTADATTEVVLVTSDPTTFIFRAFHGVMDAKGLGTWAADVFRVLRGEEPLGAPDPTADHTLVDHIGAPGTPTRLLPTCRSPLGAGAPTRGGEQFLWRHRSVDGTHPSAVARIAAVLADTTGHPVRLMVPVDLRRHDPTIRSTANLALPLFLDADPGQSAAEINARLLVGMVEGRELNEMDNGGLAKIPTPIIRRILKSVHTFGARTNRNLVSAIVSHAGKIDLAALSAPEFAATAVRALPVHIGLVPISFVVVESGTRTEITVSCRAGRGVAERLEALLDRIIAEFDPTAAQPAPPSRGVDGPGNRQNVNSLFQLQVRTRPDAVAVVAPDSEYTYAEIDWWADAVAAELLRRGIGRGSIVAVLADRSVEGTVAQVAILRAGAAFLPLDPKHPADRLADTIADSGAALLLTRPHLRDLVSTDIDVVVVDDIDQDTDEPVHVPVTADDIAFVTYTSGSTGRPKGVLVPHGGVVHYLESASDWYKLGPDTRFAHYHTPAADMACAAFFSPLLTGGAVTLIPDDISHLTLQTMLRDSGANTFLLTPSLLEIIVRLEIDVPTPRTVIIGGEQLHPALAGRARTFFGPDAHLLNSYGPTELSIVCASHVIGSPDDPASPSIPIGHPAANTPVFLLDEHQQPVPAGEVGELYFGGPQVARGYLARPELTAQRFVHLPSGERTYRTGDLARLLPSGELDFVGRADHQVKIRGNRVEPGEVQSVLEHCPGVSRAAVLGRAREDGGNVLVAYMIADHSDDTTVRDFLSDRLPAYMIPSTLHFVDELPLTANGKLDDSRLPGASPAPATAQAPVTVDPAVDSDLTAITTIWADVLHLDNDTLNLDSDFFALGGDSLASVEMLAKVSRTVVGAAAEPLFAAQLEGLLHHLTLSRVHAAATTARTGVNA
ncbi:non-ribosomal peptide synthetase [Rhodococcus sp. BH5]|uniref:non-ribosomal peptide synthetase n=1 Tax=Rhodococcus sp. BH5 TaxID=2871702 RepID=UPI0022CD9BBC|nr:non-ribosomal peptide synthetase [Rhodococcus sp. BH5]MCZ9635194.1 non-ribosomal peptide synthetase [Rhodococcus sp. BH5]